MLTGEELVRDVVRGNAGLKELVADGWPIEPHADGYTIGASLRRPVIVGIKDVATGLARISGGSHARQVEWAKLILHASAIIDLRLDESSAFGELLLEELWELAAGQAISPETLAATREFLR